MIDGLDFNHLPRRLGVLQGAAVVYTEWGKKYGKVYKVGDAGVLLVSLVLLASVAVS